MERFDLAKDIQLDTEVVAAVFDEARTAWTVTTGAATVTARYVINAARTALEDQHARHPRHRDLRRARHTNAWPDDLDIQGKGSA